MKTDPAPRRVAWALAAIALASSSGDSISSHLVLHAQVRQASEGQASLSATQALDLYSLGDAEVVNLVSRPGQFRLVANGLIAKGAAWIRANGPTEVSRRRLVAATFALESARLVFYSNEDRTALDLLTWASSEMRVERDPSPIERVWRHATIAVLQGGMTLSLVDRELNIARARFPNETRWIIMRAWLAEMEAKAPPSPVRRPPFDDNAEVPSSVIRAYEDALRVPLLQAESHTRLAYLRLSAGRTDLALDHARQGAQLATEADIRSLAHLFRGWALTRTGRDADAIEAYRDAYQSMPTSQSAGLWLARSLFLTGRRAEAESVVDETLRSGAGLLDDPWRMYSRGDIRLWVALIGQLRLALR